MKNRRILYLILMPAVYLSSISSGVPGVQKAGDRPVAEIQERNPIAQSNESRLVAAAQQGDDDTVRSLLAAGVNVNSTDSNGNTALSFAASNSHVKTVELLLAARINVNSANSFGNTALIFAANNSQREIVEILIAAGAEVDLADQAGFTPLMLAADMGKLEIVEALIKAGANVNAKSKVGFTALYMALRHMCDNERPCKRIKALIKKLIAKGADVNAETEDEETMLMTAAALDNAEAVKALLSAGADPNKANSLGETALCIAQKEAYAGVTELLDTITVRPCPVETTKESTRKIVRDN